MLSLSLQVRQVALASALAISGSAFAAVTVDSGPGTLNSFSSAGSPWLLSETITDIGTVVTKFENTPTSFFDYSWITKTVTNNSGTAWTSFDLELRELPGLASNDSDGLSFAQGYGLTFTSDKFGTLVKDELNERDFLNFSGGSVANGESVTFSFAMTSPFNPYYLLQTPNYVVSSVPEPETYAMLLAGLATVGGLARRRKNQA